MKRQYNADSRAPYSDHARAGGQARAQEGAHMSDTSFSARLDLALKALSISRGRLASQLEVDKSVISRWLNGRQAPSGHNLANLTALIAEQRPGFSLLDWEASAEAFTARLVPSTADFGGIRPNGWLPESVIHESRALTELRGAAYEGFWRTTRPSIGMTGRFVHDFVEIRRSSDGLLSFRLHVEDMRFQGVSVLTQTQLFSMACDPLTGVFIFAIYNAVLRHRADRLDGLTLTIHRIGGGAPVAGAVLLERVGELTSDSDRDEAAFRALAETSGLAAEDSVPQDVRDHLFRDIGPSAMAAGGAGLLTMPFATSWSRGPHLIQGGSSDD
jgi:transcriptional regulator with XRE-family HTH domain